MKMLSGGADMLTAAVVATQCLVPAAYLWFHRHDRMQTSEVQA
jgi:hypothetical protein